MVDSELGEIPEGWEVSSLEEIANVKIGKTPPRKETHWFSKSQGLKWVSIADLGKSNTYITDTKEKLTYDAVNEKNVNLIPNNTVLLSFKLTIGRVAIATEKMVSNEAIASFINPKISTEFLYLYLKQYKYEKLGNTSSIATAVNSKIIKKIPIVIPSEKFEESFLTIVDSIFKKIRSSVFEINNLSEIRDSLLPRLLSGEIELPEDEEV